MTPRRPPFLQHPATLITALLLAFWPVWVWYGTRLTDGSDEPWGLLALLTALGLLACRRTTPRRPNPVGIGLGLMAYAAAVLWLPPLLRAVAAMAVLGYVLGCLRLGRAFHVGLWGLLLLSLPWLATLQFYLGYPLRAFTALLAAPLLQLGGFGVVASGAALDWQGLLISVDAPCSGIRMLWMALYLTLTLGWALRLSARRTGLAVAATLVLVILVNTLRAAALFYLEADVLALPAWTHDGVGVVLFVGLAAALMAGLHRLAQPTLMLRGTG